MGLYFHEGCRDSAFARFDSPQEAWLFAPTVLNQRFPKVVDGRCVSWSGRKDERTGKYEVTFRFKAGPYEMNPVTQEVT